MSTLCFQKVFATNIFIASADGATYILKKFSVSYPKGRNGNRIQNNISQNIIREAFLIEGFLQNKLRRKCLKETIFQNISDG